MLGTDGYEWLGENAMKNRNGTQPFQNLKSHYDCPADHFQYVAEANQILD